ncbi:lantibiotic dehydratase [Paucibacter sp. APW11]|uniref:Lantibiotic dehydratase n=1 Tax=Roseateles aquae TaxID=3077235 RepID=A0ABU3PBB2_9BURK|nr:lantibiotic dehydratase [Paucibacter sp. APW11]MDT8999852.1 lantibiotic dehydratase [Paucibacter sp. APW11]
MHNTMQLETQHGEVLLHPRYVMRVAGEPAALLRQLETGATSQALNEQRELAASLRSRADQLCTSLERLISACEDKVLSRNALNLKRALFNLRHSKPELIEGLRQSLSGEQIDALHTFNADLARFAAMDQQIQQAYEQELAEGSKRLPKLWQQTNLQNAISYSNPDLFHDFQALTAADGKPLNAKARRKLEDTLAQYIARCSSKTSPLSSFTVLHVGRWQEGSDSWQLDYQSRLDKRVQLKGALLRQIMAPLLSSYKLSSQLFALCLNPSAQFKDGRLRFRTINQGNTASGRFWGTGEAIAELNVNGVITCIHHVFAQRGFEPMRSADLIVAIRALAPKLQADVLETFIAKLYELQLLLPDTQGYEQTDALDWAERLLQELPGEEGIQGRRVLGELRVALQDFCDANAPLRAELVTLVRDKVVELREALGATEHSAMSYPNFFENCYLKELEGALSPGLLQPFADDLGLLLKLSPVVSFTQQARCNMADFFLATHGAKGVCTDVLGFIDRFDEVYGLGSMSHVIDKSKLAPESEISSGYMRAKAAYENYLEPLLRSGEDVQLDPAILAEIADTLPAQVRQRGASQSYLGQLALNEGRPKFVLNQIFGGRGALMSRFMEVLSGKDLQEVRDYLQSSSESGLYAELPGVFGFNANHHPRMADHEVVIPPFAPNWEDSHKFDINTLRLVYDAKEHMVRFQTEDGRELDLWYQGFLMPVLLPRIQRVLALAYTEGINNFTLSTLMKRGMIDTQGVTRVPRISLGDVVLARRTAIMPLALQPDADLSAPDFFIAVQRWREQHQLPNEVFIRVVPVAAEAGGNGGSGGQSSINWNEFDFKDMKPFYVKLDSPRLVRLLQRMMKRNSFSLVLSEVLPALDDQHVRMAGEAHVAELQFEISTLPPRLSASQSQASWHAVRIAYFDDDRRALLLGPVQDCLDMLAQRYQLRDVMLMPHWKHGPHIDLVVHCEATLLEAQVLPALRAVLEPWLEAHPSTTELDPAAYEALSHKIALTELEPGPYLPLLQNNTVTLAPYQPSRALKLAEFARNKERFLSGSLDLTLRLLREKPADADAFMLTLLAMMGLAAQSYEAGGFSRGYVSFRSHAEYYFAAYDKGNTLRQRFDGLDHRLGARVDEVLSAVLAGRIADCGLPEAHRAVLDDWLTHIAQTAADNQRVVRNNYQVLLADETFERLAEEVSAETPTAYQDQMRQRQTSEIGRAFQQDEGLRVMNSPQFMAYRTTVNFFYFLLPILGVSPTQKFCLCHLLANSAERQLGISWREIMGLSRQADEVQA